MGKTATRGAKGQSARNNIHPNFEGGQTPIQRRLPVKKGFRNVNHKEFAIVNLDDLQNLFDEGAEVTPEMLIATGIISGVMDGVKGARLRRPPEEASPCARTSSARRPPRRSRPAVERPSPSLSHSGWLWRRRQRRLGCARRQQRLDPSDRPSAWRGRTPNCASGSSSCCRCSPCSPSASTFRSPFRASRRREVCYEALKGLPAFQCSTPLAEELYGGCPSSPSV